MGILDVAREAHVSASTVSKALSGAEHVYTKTRIRVSAAARKLGYSPALAAGILRGRPSPLIGVFGGFYGGWAVTEMLWGLMQGLDRGGLHPVVYDWGYMQKTAFSAKHVVDQGMLGGIICAKPEYLISLGGRRRTMDLPVVTLEFAVPWAHSVVHDNFGGGFMAGEKLRGRADRYLVLAPRSREILGQQRTDGFLKALAQEPGPRAKAKVMNVVRGNHVQEGYAFGQTLRPRAGERVGVFSAWGDLFASGLVRAWTEQGLKLKKDFLVIGYDGLKMSASLKPAISSIRQAVTEMGQATADLMLKALENPGLSPKHQVFQAEFVRGETA